MNEKQIRARYTLEFKQEAVRQVKDDRAAAVVARTLGMPKASLSNWVRAEARGSWPRPATAARWWRPRRSRPSRQSSRGCARRWRG